MGSGMGQEMDKARFQALADAYGGDVTRWPEAEREAALALLADQPAMARTVLAAALSLDTVLDALPTPAVRADLRARLLAAAPKARSGPGPWRRWLAGAGVGLTLATACAAGVAVGVAAAQPSADDRRADAALSETGFDVGADPSALDRT
jgi:hypothetical protein